MKKVLTHFETLHKLNKLLQAHADVTCNVNLQNDKITLGIPHPHLAVLEKLKRSIDKQHGIKCRIVTFRTKTGREMWLTGDIPVNQHSINYARLKLIKNEHREKEAQAILDHMVKLDELEHQKIQIETII